MEHYRLEFKLGEKWRSGGMGYGVAWKTAATFRNSCTTLLGILNTQGSIVYDIFVHFSDTLEGGLSSDQRSVMSGGTVRGWLPDVAVVLWRRVLGLLGDPNDVASPLIHAQIFKYLSELMDTLVKVRNTFACFHSFTFTLFHIYFFVLLRKILLDFNLGLFWILR